MSTYKSVFGFKVIINQEQPKRILTACLKTGHIPHAFLFTGKSGVGKRITAMTFAMACNCMGKEPDTTEPCGNCISCLKIKSGNHPDIITISPSGSYIKIAQIRSLCHILAMKPYEARLRVVIISDAQTMNPSAGNALLKVLEEPPARTILILTAVQSSDLLTTIVSRCQHIRFNPISTDNIVKVLTDKEGVDVEEAAVVANIADGSLSRALAMVKSSHRTSWPDQRSWLINAIGLDRPETMPMQPIGLLLAYAERLSKSKSAVADSLEVIQSWLRDLVIYKYSPEKILNRDLIDKIQSASQQADVKLLLSKIEAVQTAERNIEAKANLKLTLEMLAMRLAFG